MKQKAPFLITLFGMFLGVFIAILFGINEDFFKDRISADLQHNAKVVELKKMNTQGAEADALKYISTEADKNWRYYQRFHFHSTGIGAMSLAILVMLLISAAPTNQTLLASYLVAIGGFLYPFIWLFAGIYGPTMGRTAAKEAFAIFGYMGGLFMVGVILSIYLVARFPLKKV